MNVIVLAAGKGSRMKSSKAKVLHTISGKPMVWHVLGSATSAGAARLVAVVGHEAEAVQASILAWPDLSVPIEFVLQDPPQGTGHAVACAFAGVCLPDSAQTLVLYGDVPLIRPETLARLAHQAADVNGLGLLTVHLTNPKGYGRILRSESGAVLGCVEEKDATEGQRAIQEVNTGILVAPTDRLRAWVGRLDNQNAQGEFYLTDVLAMAVAEGLPVIALDCPDPIEVLGVNSQSQRALLERHHQRRLAEALMDQGAEIADPGRIDIRGELKAEAGVRIDVGCVFEGQVSLGAGVCVGPNCVLIDVTVSEGARIEAMSHLERCRVGPRAVVGPYARLRPGTDLGEASHVGNFTELKNTSLGPYSKANHLSYVGDASVGARVNIGAGTITCNYDGAEKHRTIIEDDVFIGSDTQLVAPVVVHEGATLGAGTTLTSDAPAGQLTLSRARQATIPRWKRPKKQSH